MKRLSRRKISKNILQITRRTAAVYPITKNGDGIYIHRHVLTLENICYGTFLRHGLKSPVSKFCVYSTHGDQVSWVGVRGLLLSSWKSEIFFAKLERHGGCQKGRRGRSSAICCVFLPWEDMTNIGEDFFFYIKLRFLTFHSFVLTKRINKRRLNASNKILSLVMVIFF